VDFVCAHEKSFVKSLPNKEFEYIHTRAWESPSPKNIPQLNMVLFWGYLFWQISLLKGAILGFENCIYE